MTYAQSRRFPRAALVVALGWLLTLAGCGRSDGIVPVTGKITLNGGAWPKPGYVVFSPAKAADGKPLVPGMARFETDGAFSVKTGEQDGLMPGQYKVAIRCWEREPGHGKGETGKSALPDRFGDPSASGLELKVEPGSGPIVFNKDVLTR